MYPGDFQPACINAYYAALGRANDTEWYMSIYNLLQTAWIVALTFIGNWWVLPWLALWIYIDDFKPHISGAPWNDLDWFEYIMYAYEAWLAWLFEPWAFFFSQLFTWGESDLQGF